MNDTVKSTGRVKWFNDLQGFGIIVDDTSGDEVYVHHSAIIAPGQPNLHEGQQVQFEAYHSRRGIQACTVRLKN